MSESQDRSDKPGGVLGWIIAHPKATAALVVVLFLIAACALFDAAAGRRLDRQLAAIRAAGEPVTVEDLNAAMPVIPDEENMAIALLRHIGSITAAKMPKEKSDFLPLIGMARSPGTGQHLPARQLETARWYLDAHADEIAGIHKALTLDRGLMQVVWTTPAFNVTYGNGLSTVRNTFRLLALEATLAAEDGNPTRAGVILSEMLYLDDALELPQSLIGALTRLAARGLAQDQIERTVNLCGLDASMLKRIQSSLRETESQPDMKRAMMTERVHFIDTLEWLRSRGGVSGLRGQPAGPMDWWKYVPALPELDEGSGLAIMSGLVDAIDRPDAHTIRRAKAADAKASSLAWYCVLSRMSVGSLSRCVELWVRGVGQNRALQAALACERYRLAKGRWPDGLRELVPAYLEAVPVDPSDDKPIRFQRIDEGIKVWTIGEDLIDNGGDVRRLAPPRSSPKPTDFGWVLLNPELRGRPAEEPERDGGG